MKEDNSLNPRLPEEIDKLIHEPARLKLMAQLFVIESADFLFLMKQTELTQGNLSAHLAKLENVKYVEIEKGYNGKRPQTTIRLSKEGRVEFEKYLNLIRSFTRQFE